MSKKKKLGVFIDVNDDTPIQKLGVLDQIKVIISGFAYDPGQELKPDDEVTIKEAQLQADLLDFIRNATEPIRHGKHTSVIMKISNAFDPVLNDVLESRYIKNFYSVDIKRPEIKYDIPYYILLRLEVRDY